MLPEYFAIIGAVIASFGGLYYLYETIVGKSKPNRVSWLLWGVMPLIIFVAQRVQGVEGLSWISFAAGFTPLLIVAASFLNKKAYWKTKPLDYILMIAALAGVALWFITSDPNMATLLVLVADLLAGIPTVLKSIKHPETESWIAYLISTVGFGIGILAIHSFNFEHAAFVIYLFAIQLLLTLLTVRAVFRSK
ncbi:MAG TPA: hypothetical protein PK265_00280 [Candidatus Saccharibacteria bacterium]|nr:hypothetical protein [Candidatus Saccharibacteria bacterium]HRQ97749.1 hypothetical protein [Candidatus Saccharibacteria bacterium]